MFDGLFARAGLHDREAVFGQPLRHDLPERRFVVDQQEVLRDRFDHRGRRYFDTILRG